MQRVSVMWSTITRTHIRFFLFFFNSEDVEITELGQMERFYDILLEFAFASKKQVNEPNKLLLRKFTD